MLPVLLITVLLPLNYDRPCSSWDDQVALIADEKFVVWEGRGCEARTSPWSDDGSGWTTARFGACWYDYDVSAPDQVGAFRVIDGVAEFRLFPEDGVLSAFVCPKAG